MQQTIQQIYLIHGGEPLVTEEIISKIRNTAHKNGYNNNEVLEINAQFAWDELLNRCKIADLFASKSLIELRLASDINKNGESALESILTNNDPNLCIIIRANKLKPKVYKSKWYQLIAKHGSIQIAKPISAEQLPSWVQERLKKNGFNPSKEVVAFLSKLYEGNLLACSQAISHLNQQIPKGDLSLEQIKPFVHNNAQFNIFDLANAARIGNTEKTFLILNSLKDAGVEPLLMLWALNQEIKKINSGTIKSKLLTFAKQIDLQAKGIESGDVWDTLLSAYLHLATKEELII